MGLRGNLSPMAVRRVGKQKTRLYIIWIEMRQRCSNPNRPMWPDYGGRGITVCEEWASFDLFAAWAEANGYTEALELDRRNNDGPYSPDNCRWVTHQVNARNRRDNTLWTAWGETKTRAEWGEDSRCVISLSSVAQRLRRGWSVEDALSQPMRSMCERGLHKLTPESRYPNGQCRPCRIEGSREYRRRKKEEAA